MTTLAELSDVPPGRIAVDDSRLRLTWAQLDERSVAVAHGLEALGARPGDHVAICIGNRSEFVEVVLGAWRAGCAYTPVKTGWTASEVAGVLDDASTRVVVADRDGAREAARARALPLVDVDGGYDAWLRAADRSPLPEDRCGYKLPFTSGTSGRPKGVVMSGSGTTPFRDGWAGIARYAEALSLPGTGTHLFASRLFNGAPQTFGFGALARGATLRILPRWDPRAALAALADADVSSTIMVPTMFRQLLALPGVDRTSSPAPGLVTLLHGGEPCPVAIKAAMAAWFGDVLVEYYGFTEGGMTIVRADEWRDRPGTVGRPLAGLEVHILGPDGAPLPPRVEGTVYFTTSGGRRFRYTGDDEQTESAHVGDAFTVGDIGFLDEDGYLYLSGRSADVVITAGVNVYPAEVEQALADVPGVLDMCAFGLPDPDVGEVVAVDVVPTPDTDATALLDRLADAAGERLAPYKRPRRLVCVTEVPRDETGKLLRRLARDRATSTGDAASTTG